MQKWEKFTAAGAIGPDIFFFSEDWSNDVLGPRSDDIMLALAVYYFFDAAKEDDWKPLLHPRRGQPDIDGDPPLPHQAAEGLEGLRQGLGQDRGTARRRR